MSMATLAPNKAVKPFACGSLGRSALRTCSGMASPFLPEQALHAERRLPGRYRGRFAPAAPLGEEQHVSE